MPPADVSSSRALNAILPLVSSGQPYEAHQKARTFASRYSKSGQYDTAIDVLFQSARELLKSGQQGSGTDLALFLLDVYENKGENVTDESRGKLTQLIVLTGSSGSWRKTIIDRAVVWSAKHGTCPAGDPDLHHYIGELLYKDGAFDAAEPHFLASGKRDSARLLAQMMVDWSAVGGVPGTFALRGTLPYLENGNILAARTFIVQFVNKILSSRPSLASSIQTSTLSVTDSSEVIFTTDNVLNFCQLAVMTCQRAQGDKNKAIRECWVRLCGTYQSKGGVLASREIRSVLGEIATLYFAVPPPRNQPDNPLGAMLSSMLGGGAPGGGPQRRVLTPGLTRPSTPGLD
ncbi:cytoplasmic protein [Gyrodon lividus]|nr:cytoplasmic protein [Gyrodon lividus]